MLVELDVMQDIAQRVSCRNTVHASITLAAQMQIRQLQDPNRHGSQSTSTILGCPLRALRATSASFAISGSGI